MKTILEHIKEYLESTVKSGEKIVLAIDTDFAKGALMADKNILELIYELEGKEYEATKQA